MIIYYNVTEYNIILRCILIIIYVWLRLTRWYRGYTTIMVLNILLIIIMDTPCLRSHIFTKLIGESNHDSMILTRTETFERQRYQQERKQM